MNTFDTIKQNAKPDVIAGMLQDLKCRYPLGHSFRFTFNLFYSNGNREDYFEFEQNGVTAYVQYINGEFINTWRD